MRINKFNVGLILVVLFGSANATMEACGSVFSQARNYTDILSSDQRTYILASEACSYRSSNLQAAGRITDLGSQLGFSASGASEIVRQACDKKQELETKNSFLSVSTSQLLSNTLPLYQACLDASLRKMQIRLVVDDLFPRIVQISLAKPDGPGEAQERISAVSSNLFSCEINARTQDGVPQPRRPASDSSQYPMTILGPNTAEIVCKRTEINSDTAPSISVSVDGNPLVFTFPKRDPRVLTFCAQINSATAEQQILNDAYDSVMARLTQEIARRPSNGSNSSYERRGFYHSRNAVRGAIGTRMNEQTARLTALSTGCRQTLEVIAP